MNVLKVLKNGYTFSLIRMYIKPFLPLKSWNFGICLWAEFFHIASLPPPQLRAPNPYLVTSFHVNITFHYNSLKLLMVSFDVIVKA